MLLCSVFLMMHDVFHKAVYILLLFLFLVHIVNILTWCFLPCWMRIAAFNLTIAYLTFSQLLFCFEDVKFVPFTLFFLALLKFCFSCAKDFMCFMILVCFFFDCLCILCFLPFPFLSFFHTSLWFVVEPSLHLTDCFNFVLFWSSSCHTAMYTFCTVYMKTFPFQRFLCLCQGWFAINSHLQFSFRFIYSYIYIFIFIKYLVRSNQPLLSIYID